MEVKNRDINTISPYPDNAKKHPAKQISLIAKSIQEFGFNQSVVVDKEGVIIVGHGRYFAAKSIGMKEVPTLELDLPEDKANAYRLADNKMNESDWQMKIVIDELKALPDDLVDITGFDRAILIEDDNTRGEVDFTTEIMESNNYVVFVFNNDIDWGMIEETFKLPTVKTKETNAKNTKVGIGRVLDGKKLLELL